MSTGNLKTPLSLINYHYIYQRCDFG